MTTRTELIAGQRWAHAMYGNVVFKESADMLEADAVQIARLKDVPMMYKRMAFNAELQHEVDKLREAARMALDAIRELEDRMDIACPYVAAKAHAALTEALK